MCVCVGECGCFVPPLPNRQDVFKYHLWSPALVIFSNCGQKKLTKGLCVCSRRKLSNAGAPASPDLVCRCICRKRSVFWPEEERNENWKPKPSGCHRKHGIRPCPFAAHPTLPLCLEGGGPTVGPESPVAWGLPRKDGLSGSSTCGKGFEPGGLICWAISYSDVNAGASAGALGFSLWWAVFLPRLLWFTVYLSVQNCFAESSGFAPDLVPLRPCPAVAPWHTLLCTPFLGRALLPGEKNHLGNRHQAYPTGSLVGISRNGNLGKSKFGFQTAVQKRISPNGQRKSVTKPWVPRKELLNQKP